MKLHFSGFEAAIETLDFQFLFIVHNILQISVCSLLFSCPKGLFLLKSAIALDPAGFKINIKCIFFSCLPE